MPRLILVVPLLAALACACAAPLARAATVTIAPPNGGPPRALDLASLEPQFDVHGRPYTLRAADGTTSSVTVADGISLGSLLRAAGLDGDPFGYVVVPGPDGVSGLLLADDLVGTDEGPPVVWTDQQGVHFLRPARNPRDVNTEDLVTVPDGTLTLQLNDGDPVKPQASVSTLHPRSGDPVDFSASLAAGSLRPGWGYAWYFGDGSGEIPGAAVTHRFPKAATATTYPVQVNVVDATGQAIGPAGVVYLRVAAAAPKRSSAAQSAATGGVVAAVTGGGAGTGAASGSAGSAGSAHASLAIATPARHISRPHPAPPGDLVTGTLLHAASAAATSAPTGAEAQAAGAAAARRVEAGGPLHVPVGAWVAPGLLALLGLGWALESRHTLPFWQP